MLLPASRWLLAASCWLLAAGCRLTWGGRSHQGGGWDWVLGSTKMGCPNGSSTARNGCRTTSPPRAPCCSCLRRTPCMVAWGCADGRSDHHQWSRHQNQRHCLVLVAASQHATTGAHTRGSMSQISIVHAMRSQQTC